MDAFNRDIPEVLTGSHQHRRTLPVLEKKLDELESQIEDLILQTPPRHLSSVSLPDLHHLRCQRIEGKIEFIKNLLIREMEPEQLSWADRLAALEASYKERSIWVGFDASPLDGRDTQDDDCSCTHSCIAEREDDGVPWLEMETVVPTESEITEVPQLQESEGGIVMTETQKESGGYTSRRIMSTVVIIVAVIVAAFAAAFFNAKEGKDSVVPT